MAAQATLMPPVSSPTGMGSGAAMAGGGGVSGRMGAALSDELVEEVGARPGQPSGVFTPLLTPFR
jgi:hypothetical protein